MKKIFKFFAINSVAISILFQTGGISTAKTSARSDIFRTARRERVAEEKTHKQNAVVDDINILFLQADYGGLLADGEDALQHAALGEKDRKEILYLMGLSCIKLGDFNRARKMFDEILVINGASFNEEALIGIADSYFDEKNFDKATESYENIMRKFPDSARLSGMYYNIGLCYKAKKNTEKANLYFQKIKEKYGTSFEADKVECEPTVRKTTYYIIQLGAFKSLGNANKLARKLARKKHDYYIQKTRKNGKTLYRLRGGKFSNKYYALRLLKQLKKDGFAAKIIIE